MLEEYTRAEDLKMSWYEVKTLHCELELTVQFKCKFKEALHMALTLDIKLLWLPFICDEL